MSTRALRGRPTQPLYPGGVGLSHVSDRSKTPRAVSTDDPRLKNAALAAAVLGGFLRTGEILVPAEQPWPTSQAEYLVPDLVLSAPRPAMVLTWNRVVIFPWDTEEPPDGFYWTYRTTDAPPVQRVRLGRNPDPGDIVMSILYVIDFVTGGVG